jgi:hypothetical protein
MEIVVARKPSCAVGLAVGGLLPEKACFGTQADRSAVSTTKGRTVDTFPPVAGPKSLERLIVFCSHNLARYSVLGVCSNS